MRYYKKLVLLVFIPLISGTVGLMFGLSFANPSISIIGIISTLLGMIIGAGIGRYFSIIDKRAAYIANAQNVLIIAIKQYNEFTIIKNGFKEFQSMQRDILEFLFILFLQVNGDFQNKK